MPSQICLRPTRHTHLRASPSTITPLVTKSANPNSSTLLPLDPASLSVFPRTSTPAPLPALPSTLRTPLLRRRSHKRKIHGQDLIEQFHAMGALDGGFSFALGGVLD